MAAAFKNRLQDSDMDNDYDSEMEDFINGKMGVGRTLSTDSCSDSTDSATVSPQSDYSESEMKNLLMEDMSGEFKNCEDFYLIQSDHGRGLEFCPVRPNLDLEGIRNSTISIDADDPTGSRSSILDSNTKVTRTERKTKKKVKDRAENGPKIANEGCLASESESNLASSSDSDSETEQERWDSIVQTVKRMKLLLIKYPQFANRVGNNNIVSSLHAMMDTLESKDGAQGKGERVTSMDLKMVEEQMELFKETLLSGIDEDLAKWRSQRRRSKHNVTRILSIFMIVAVVTSFVVSFFNDSDF